MTTGCLPVCLVRTLLHWHCSQTSLAQQPVLVRPPHHCSKGLSQEGCNGNRMPADSGRTFTLQQCARLHPVPCQKMSIHADIGHKSVLLGLAALGSLQCLREMSCIVQESSTV